jgi:hypothetical protein
MPAVLKLGVSIVSLLATLGGGAAALLVGEAQGMAIDFTDRSMVIRDTGTPANNFTGDPFSKLSFTRATIATRVNEQGYIETVASGVPRIDYDPVTLACKGLLIETASTNLLLRSEEFDNASWSKSQLTISANATTSPDGLVDADALVESTTASTFHFANQTVTKAASSITYSASVYAKANGREFNFNVQASGGVNGVAMRCTPANGTITGSLTAFGAGWTAVASGVENAGNGWYRYWIVCTSDTTTNVVVQFGLNNGAGVTYTGDGVSGVYLWGAQLEALGFRTSYVPTTSAAVTRNIELCQLATSAFPMGAGPYSYFFQGLPGTPNPTTDPNSHLPLSFSSGAFAESTYFSRLASSNTVTPSCVTGGAGNITVTGQTSAYNTRLKAMLGLATNNGNWAFNGVTPSADDTVMTLPVGLIRMSIGNADWSGGAGPTTVWGGWIEKIMVVPRRMSNAEMQARTA